MRILYLLLLLAVITITLSQFKRDKPIVPATPSIAQSTPELPAIPTRPQDVKAFGQDLNRFMQDAAAQRPRQEPQQ